MPHMRPQSSTAKGQNSAPWTTAPPTVFGRWTAYGSAVPHLARSFLFRDDRSQKRQAPRPACAGCALLLSQACATMSGLSAGTPLPTPLRPSARSGGTTPPDTTPSRFDAAWSVPGASGLSFHACLCVYLCWAAPLHDWAVCRVSPFGPTYTLVTATIS